MFAFKLFVKGYFSVYLPCHMPGNQSSFCLVRARKPFPEASLQNFPHVSLGRNLHKSINAGIMGFPRVT